MKTIIVSIPTLLLALSLSNMPLAARELQPAVADSAGCNPMAHVKRGLESLGRPAHKVGKMAGDITDDAVNDGAEDEPEDKTLFLLRPLSDSSTCERHHRQHPEVIAERGALKVTERPVTNPKRRDAGARDSSAIRPIRFNKIQAA